MLSRQPAFSEKISLTQYAQRCFLANLRHDGEPNLAILDIKYRVGRVPLRKDRFLLGKRHNFPALADRGKKFLRVELAIDLGRHGGCHQRYRSQHWVHLLTIVSNCWPSGMFTIAHNCRKPYVHPKGNLAPPHMLRMCNIEHRPARNRCIMWW